jgi:hypothetical protein
VSTSTLDWMVCFHCLLNNKHEIILPEQGYHTCHLSEKILFGAFSDHFPKPRDVSIHLVSLGYRKRAIFSTLIIGNPRGFTDSAIHVYDYFYCSSNASLHCLFLFPLLYPSWKKKLKYRYKYLFFFIGHDFFFKLVFLLFF